MKKYVVFNTGLFRLMLMCALMISSISCEKKDEEPDPVLFLALNGHTYVMKEYTRETTSAPWKHFTRGDTFCDEDTEFTFYSGSSLGGPLELKRGPNRCDKKDPDKETGIWEFTHSNEFMFGSKRPETTAGVGTYTVINISSDNKTIEVVPAGLESMALSKYVMTRVR